MRVVVVGATGNVGSAVLRRLHAAPEVTSIAGVARRIPDQTVAPYSDVGWTSVDIGAPDARVQLGRAFAGADAVIHLAWALQPNRDERAMSRTNVAGTANVLAALADQDVPQLAIASSVGAYSFGPKRRRVDESWPTGGIASSHYSRHKAINERALDRFEREHPDVVVSRIRPGLVFQGPAGAEIAGLFLGRAFPTGWLTRIRPAVIPLPSQSIFQAVHADDVADAFWRTIDRRAGGAFNIAAEPVLGPDLIAVALGAPRTVPIRASVVRALMWASWRLHLQATDPGWLDIATSVPIMSTERARTVLGWSPTISATDALAEVIAGLANRSNVPASGPLRGW